MTKDNMEILARFRGIPATDGSADGPSVNAPTTEELWRSRVDQAAKIIDGNVAEIERLRARLKDVQIWTLKQDDTVWYDTITTLHDFCDMSLNNGFVNEQNEPNR